MSVSLDRVLISPSREDFFLIAREPVKPVSLPFFHCNLFQITNFPARYITYQNYYYRNKFH